VTENLGTGEKAIIIPAHLLQDCPGIIWDDRQCNSFNMPTFDFEQNHFSTSIPTVQCRQKIFVGQGRSHI
jgi:hypothetical protein